MEYRDDLIASVRIASDRVRLLLLTVVTLSFGVSVAVLQFRPPWMGNWSDLRRGHHEAKQRGGDGPVLHARKLGAFKIPTVAQRRSGATADMKVDLIGIGEVDVNDLGPLGGAYLTVLLVLLLHSARRQHTNLVAVFSSAVEGNWRPEAYTRLSLTQVLTTPKPPPVDVVVAKPRDAPWYLNLVRKIPGGMVYGALLPFPILLLLQGMVFLDVFHTRYWPGVAATGVVFLLTAGLATANLLLCREFTRISREVVDLWDAQYAAIWLPPDSDDPALSQSTN